MPGGDEPPPGRYLTREQKKNIVLLWFWTGEAVMFRAVVEEAAALASISLFIGMLAVWVQVFATL
jgi:hypothetical protein